MPAPELLHHAEPWVPRPAPAERSWGRLLGALGSSRTSTGSAAGPEHRAAYLEDADDFEVELVAVR
jgi:hypothetical protein